MRCRHVPARLACLALAALLAACSSLAPPADQLGDWSEQQRDLLNLQAWQLRGRVNIRYHGDSHTPRIQWQQASTDYNIRLWGTFNAGNTRIEGRPGFVSLTQGNEVVTADSPENLILDHLGYELPVSHLEYWIRGIPVPGAQADMQFNALNQVALLQQDGWTVNYTDMRQYQEYALPRRVEITRSLDDIRLVFVGLSWELP